MWVWNRYKLNVLLHTFISMVLLSFDASAATVVQSKGTSAASAKQPTNSGDRGTVQSRRTLRYQRKQDKRKKLKAKVTGPYTVSADIVSKPPEEWLKRKSNESDFQIMKKEFTSFFSTIEKRFRNVVRKRHIYVAGDPYTIQGIPIVFNSLTTGFNLGIRIAMFNIRRTNPYKAKIMTQYWSSDRGRKTHRLLFDFPKIFDSKWRILFHYNVNATVTESFVGIGTMSKPDLHKANPNDPDFVNLRYYDFRREMNLVSTRVTRSVGKTPFLFEGSLAFQFNTIMESAANQQLFVERPLGVDGGRTSFVGFGVAYDTRDFEPYPTKGIKTEFYVTQYPKWLGSEYSFTRITLSDLRYKTLRPGVVLAHHWVFEGILGGAPFFELDRVGGWGLLNVSGGSGAMRGFLPSRFLGHFKWVQQLELRYEFGRSNVWRQRFDFSFVPHIDLIRAWDKSKPFTITNFAISGGFGMRIRWNKNFVVRTDVAFSREHQLLQLGFGNTF